MEEYFELLAINQRAQLEIIRNIAKQVLPDAKEVISYQIPALKFNNKVIVFYAAFKDHVSIYPVPKNLPKELKKYQKGKGTLWFSLDSKLPKGGIKRVILELRNQRLGK